MSAKNKQTTATAEPPTGHAVTAAAAGTAVAQTTDYADKYSGEETFVDREHMVTPQIKILQGLSPQIKKNNVAYVEGATPGMIFLSSYHKPLIHGEDGILFQPCLFQPCWEVRTPKESGAVNFVEVRDEPDKSWTKLHAEKLQYVYYRTPEGNLANLTHTHIGLVHLDGQVMPYAIKFAGSGIFVSKQFNGIISSRRTDSQKPAARFTFLYRMRVKSQTNAMGEWGQWAITPEGKASEHEQDIGHELVVAFREKRATVEQEPSDELSPGSSGDNETM
jgi:hypothetical protein